MDLFEKKIEEQVNKRRPDLKIEEGVHTIGEFIDAVFTIETLEDTKRFYEGYLKYLSQHVETAGDEVRVARSNIGWCFGEGMAPSRIKMWNDVCRAAHPVFSTTVPTPREELEAGIKHGKKLRTT